MPSGVGDDIFRCAGIFAMGFRVSRPVVVVNIGFLEFLGVREYV